MRFSIARTWNILSLLFVVLLASCTPAVPTATEELKSIPAGMPMLNPEVSGEIKLWHWWSSPIRHNAVRRIIALCEQQLPNISVVDTVKPFQALWEETASAVREGTGMPDVIVSDRPTLPGSAAEGTYMDLQEWADRDGVTRDQFYDWAWDQTLYEDHTYGIPFETDIRVLFYNKQAFEEAGLDPNAPPKTWDELWAVADHLDRKNPDGSYDRIAFFPLWNAGLNPFWMYLNGARLVSEDGRVMLNDPKAVETLEWVKMWVDRYGGWEALEEYRAAYNADPANDLFMSGKVAMLTDIYGYNSQLQFYRPNHILPDGSSEKLEWGVAMLPYNEAPANWSGGFSLSIPSGAPNPEASWELIKCMSAAEAQTSWARDTLAQPPHLDAVQDPVLLADPNWAIVDQALRVSSGGVFVSDYPRWSEQLDQVLPSFWTGELTAEEALDLAQQRVDEVIFK